MAVDHVLAVVAVSDIDRSGAWYSALFGRPADNNPMPILLEWQVKDGAWVQITVDEARAGTSMLNLAVSDLQGEREQLEARGVSSGDIVDASKGVQLSALSDPDGNAITLIGGFRVQY